MKRFKYLLGMPLILAGIIVLALGTAPGIQAQNNNGKKPRLTRADRTALKEAGLLAAPAATLNPPADIPGVPHYFGPYPNWANSPFTLPDATVVISGTGTGAQAVASVGANGSITGITIVDPGSGYGNNTKVDIIGAGTGASANADVVKSGIVTAITVDTAGTGYTAPAVTISGGGATTDATATAYGSVEPTILLVNSGSGYSF
ncbi:MAG: hypothetical protein H6Q04_3274, partial [Acidobacteria bacterium]|nr:hypothetical protein [Acidobacteriota bacterium]